MEKENVQVKTGHPGGNGAKTIEKAVPGKLEILRERLLRLLLIESKDYQLSTGDKLD